MRVAYLTIDEVNYHLACQTADECGAILEVVSFAELTQEGRFDVLLMDWDYLARERGYPIVLELLASRRCCSLAVHGYHLEDDWKEILKRNGATVRRRLDPGWLACWLCRSGPKVHRRRLQSESAIQADGFLS